MGKGKPLSTNIFSMIVFTSKAHGMKALDMADPTRLGLIMLKYTEKSSASPSKSSARRKKKKKTRKVIATLFALLANAVITQV